MRRPRTEATTVYKSKATARDLAYFRRGYAAGQFFAREDAKEAASRRPRVDRLLRQREVEQLVKLSRTTIWSWVAAGDFPKPLRVGSRGIRWRESDIRQWLASPKADRT